VRAGSPDGTFSVFPVTVRIETPQENQDYEVVGILQFVLPVARCEVRATCDSTKGVELP
jgi:hypothetical protein